MGSKKIPMRRCAGCMESKPKNELLRIVYYEGDLSINPDGKAKGRGIYVCKSSKCMELAKKKKALQRGFKVDLDSEAVEKIYEELKKYAE